MVQRISSPLPFLAAVLLWADPDAPAADQGVSLRRSSFVVGDFLVVWREGTGATITYRGIPVFTPNAAEFVVHQRWTRILHHAGYGEPRATARRDDDGAVLTVRNRTASFSYEKRIVLRSGGRLRVEYDYQLLDPDAAELQVLWGLGKQWIHQSTYSAVVDGQQKGGKLSCPETGRHHPWSAATTQAFTTEYGTLTIKSQRGLALYAEPQNGVLWWAQGLAKDRKDTQVIDVRITPGPSAGKGVRLADLQWTERVRDGRARFHVSLAREADGPRRVRVHAARAGGGKASAGPRIESGLSEAATTLTCEATVNRGGHHDFAVVVDNASTGAELLRIGPLTVESSPMLRARPRLNLYTHEPRAELVVDVAEDVELAGCLLNVAVGDVKAEATPSSHRVTLSVPLGDMADGVHEAVCRLMKNGVTAAEVRTTFRKAPPKANEVKIDNVGRSLIVDGLPFIPFGYYTYYPLADGVMDEEVVRGFNLFSPYHGGPHNEEARKPIREYLDRCAAIGMKVNYHLIWTNVPELSDRQWRELREEVEAFRDHPALLSWYTADEPAADRVANLEKVYALLSELDPYHPVTIVFCRGAEHARKFADAMDIVMADPYPIPNRALTFVNETADSMNAAFDRAKPLWIVPQAFGGNEGWPREPTAREQRAMTYLALIHGARAIQYFIRSPRTSFPKSPVMWAECGALALETAELTPALTSPEPTLTVASSLPTVHVASFRDRGVVTILAANTANRPDTVRLRLEGVEYSGPADVLFEDRQVTVEAGAIEEAIDAFGTRAYALPVGPLPGDDLSVAGNNLTVNPSWEVNPSVGTPAGNYASVPPGAALFVDSRVARHGRHSLRLSAPDAEHTPGISHFPVRLKAGQRYRFSIWAKGKVDGGRLKLSLGTVLKEEVSLTQNWQEFRFVAKSEKDVGRASAGIGLASAGVAWVDLLQIVPVDPTTPD